MSSEHDRAIGRQQDAQVARYWSRYGPAHEARALEKEKLLKAEKIIKWATERGYLNDIETETGGRGEEMDGGR